MNRKNLIRLFFLFLLIGALVFNTQILAQEEIKFKTSMGEKTLEEIKEIEAEKNLKEGVFLAKLINTIFQEDNAIGNFLREFGDLPNTFTYEMPNTKHFFDKVNNVWYEHGRKLETIQEIYLLVTEAVPNFPESADAPGAVPEDLTGTPIFEEMLQMKTGYCRDQASLLNAALKKVGFDSRTVSGDEHVWVRISTYSYDLDKYVEFDLDPTWYKDFVALQPRGEGEYGLIEELTPEPEPEKECECYNLQDLKNKSGFVGDGGIVCWPTESWSGEMWVEGEGCECYNCGDFGKECICSEDFGKGCECWRDFGGVVCWPTF